MKKLIWLVLFTSVIMGCEKENDKISDNSISGKFSLNLTSSFKSSNDIIADDSISFVLDTIKSSRSFYFILNNVGQEDITDISISTDNSRFNISPSNISVLAGTKSTNNSSLIQIISLDVIHGTRINGVGYSDLMPMGDNICSITIQGNTFNGESEIPVKLKSVVKVFAKVMAISLYQGNLKYDLTKPNNQGAAGPYSCSLSIMSFYSYPSVSPPLVLKNNGNVNINMTIAKYDGYISTIGQISTIYPNDSLILEVSEPAIPPISCYIKLNSNGTIFDQQQLKLGNDGNAYFGMWYNLQIPPNYISPGDTVSSN